MDNLAHLNQLNEAAKLAQKAPWQAHEAILDIEPIEEYAYLYEAVASYINQYHDEYLNREDENL